MTSEQKAQAQKLAARYEVDGVSFISILRALASAQTGTDFETAMQKVEVSLADKYGTRNSHKNV